MGSSASMAHAGAGIAQTFGANRLHQDISHVRASRGTASPGDDGGSFAERITVTRRVALTRLGCLEHCLDHGCGSGDDTPRVRMVAGSPVDSEDSSR